MPTPPDPRADRRPTLRRPIESVDEAAVGPAADGPAPACHHVVAVLVTHDGQPWLPRTLDALAAQTRAPDHVVAADTGSSDDSRQLVSERLGEAVPMLDLPRSTGYGAAVARVVGSAPVPAEAGVVSWIWLLHDDCAPAPDALERLLDIVESRPSIGAVGPKVRGWHDPRFLQEVGVTIAGSGRRETGIERRELDQGQRDGLHDCLAVGSAGMLVRRDVWEELAGFDPRLPLFRDDVDFGWRVNRAGHRVVCVTDAVVYHAEAAARGQRELGAGGLSGRHLRLADRRHAMYVLLVNRPRWQLPLLIVRLLLGSLLRAAALLLGKRGRDGIDELRALVSVLAAPGPLRRARRDRRRWAGVPYHDVRGLLAAPSAQLQHVADRFGGVFAGRNEATTSRDYALESGPVSEEAEDLQLPGSGAWSRALRAPAVLLAAVLTVIAVVAGRDLIGPGRLFGGALLPAPGAGDLWASYLAGWHSIGLGSVEEAPPYLAVVAALGWLLGGSASLAVDLLLIGCVPLAGLSAYLCARPLTSSWQLRLWAAAAYALLPSATGAIAAGRLGTALLLVVLPPLALAAVRGVGTRGRPGTFGGAVRAGLLLALAVAFAPVVYVVATALAVLAAIVTVRGMGWLRLLVVVAVPPLLLVPWTFRLAAEPELAWREPGLATRALVDLRLDPLAVLLVHPGGPGMYPVAVSAGLLLAALAAVLRSSRRREIATAWVVALAGLGTGLVLMGVRLQSPGTLGEVPGWPGPATAIIALGLLAAALVGADDLRNRLAAASFGWRQIGAVAVVAIAVCTPVLAAAWWLVQGAADPLGRRPSGLLPAFVAADAASPDQPRTLVLRGSPSSGLRYALLREQVPQLGDADLAEPVAGNARLGAAVADLASGRGGDAPSVLAGYAIRYVLVESPVSPALGRVLDAAPGLTQISAPDGGSLWEVAGTTSRLRVQVQGGEQLALDMPRAGETVQVEASPVPRQLVLAERADPGWSATVSGRPLVPVLVDGWAQGFDLPGGGGELSMSFDSAPRHRWLWVQVAVLVVAVVLALPAARRAHDDEDAAADRLVAPPAKVATP